MDWGKIFDPTGNNFLGAGKTFGRILSDAVTLPMGTTEWFRKDPFGFGKHTIAGKVGHGIGGAMEGGVGGAGTGFATGGPYGAILGAILGGATGGVRSGLGDSDPTSLAGHGGGALGNFGIGAGEGLFSGLGISGLGSSSGAGGMSSYLPMSSPNMGASGSTFGGGMGSPLNLGLGDLGGGSYAAGMSAPNMGSAGMSTGPGGMFSSLNPMGASSATTAPSTISKVMNIMRMANSAKSMMGGGQQSQDTGAMQRQNQEQQMRLIYQMFPGLRPGAALGQQGGSQWQS